MVKTVLITGVTSGFGAVIAKDLVAKDYQVIGTGRRLERLDALKKGLGEAFFPLQMDLVLKENISLALSKLPE